MLRYALMFDMLQSNSIQWFCVNIKNNDSNFTKRVTNTIFVSLISSFTYFNLQITVRDYKRLQSFHSNFSFCDLKNFAEQI